MGEALAAASLLLFSANVLVVSVAAPRLDQSTGFLLALVANVVMAGILLVGQAALVHPPSQVRWPAVGLFAVGGLLTSFLGRRSFFRSIATLGPTRASTLQTTNPVFTALAGFVLLGEALQAKAILAGLAVLAGLVLVSHTPVASTGVRRPVLAPGTGAAVLGAAAYGVGNVARGAGVREWSEPVVGSLVGAAVGLLAYTVVSMRQRTVLTAIRLANTRGGSLWVLSGVLTIGAQTCLIAATQSVPVAVAVVVSAAVPVVVLPVGLLMRHRAEEVRTATVLGVLLVTGGVIALVLG